jgi:endo-alpha-N-acetylgalactosaminidase
VSFTAPKSGTVDVTISAVAGAAAVTIDDVRIMADTTTPVAGTTGNVVASANFEGNQPGWGPFVMGRPGDIQTSISVLHAPYSQKTWKNTHSPYNTGPLSGKAVDDVLVGNNSLKAHEEIPGLVYRTIPATISFTAGHSYKVAFKYQTNLDGQWQWVTGADTVGAGKVTSKTLTKDALPAALNTATYNKTFTAGCGDDWVGLNRIGTSAVDFVIDDFTVTDLGTASVGAACATITAPGTADLNPGTSNSYTTTFTNNETTDATNVALSLGTLPGGWSAQVSTKDGNLFATVKPGQTVSTTWLITPPASAAGTSVVLHPSGTYFNDCATKTVSSDATANVGTIPIVPTTSMTASADSENLTSGPGEGPAANVLDGDTSTIWVSQYDPTITNYPHWVQLKFDGDYTVNGFGYQGRATGGQNGKVKGYTILTSPDGITWAQVAAGILADTNGMQHIPFAPATAKYVKFRADSAINGQPFAAAAEMRVYGTSATTATGFDPAPRPADTACTP